MSVNDRGAIFAEAFPAQLADAGAEAVEWFTHDQAREVLYTFAGAWPVLGRDGERPATRFLFLASASMAYRFRGIELAPGAIVVDTISVL